MEETELQKFLRENPPGPFKPGGFYNPPGDQIDFWWADEAAYSEEINDGQYNVAAIDIGMDSKKVVGVSIYSIKQILKRAGFKLVPMTDEERCEAGLEDMGFIKDPTSEWHGPFAEDAKRAFQEYKKDDASNRP